MLRGRDDRKISESQILHGASFSYSFAFAMLNELKECRISVGNKTTLRQSKFHMSSITTSLGRKRGLMLTLTRKKTTPSDLYLISCSRNI